MKCILEVITIAHPGAGSGRPASVSQSHTELYLMSDEAIETALSTIKSYEAVATQGGGRVEIFRNILKI